MRRHPVLIPTSSGPYGAILHVPEGSSVAGAVIFQGAANGRFGQNRLWARLADRLAEDGVAVLRFDYPGQADASLIPGGLRGEEGFRALFEAIGWFRDRASVSDLLVVTRCYGSRPAFYLAEEVGGVRGIGLVVPNFKAPSKKRGASRLGLAVIRARRRARKRLARLRGKKPSARLDKRMISQLGDVLGITSVWALVGEEDRRDIFVVRDKIPARSRDRLTIELAEGVTFFNFRTPDAQRECIERVTAWAARTLGAPVAT